MKFFYVLAMFFSATLNANELNWPDLEKFGFVSGRHATEQDIADQKAIFVAKTDDGYIGTPIDIELPQYAIYTDEKDGQKYQVIVIQAEKAQGMEIYGAININDGSGLISIPADFQLLGNKK